MAAVVFKIGDKVRAKKTSNDYKRLGNLELEIVVANGYGEYGISASKVFPGGHNLYGEVNDNTGWWILETDLEPLEFNDGVDNWV